MKGLIAGFFLSLIFCSFTYPISTACDYAGSNISYIQAQTQKAIEAEKINISHYFAYKALNEKSISESLDNLKKATKVTSITSARILLERALENTLGSLEAIQEHEETHMSDYANDVLTMNTADVRPQSIVKKPTEGKALELKIDSWLINYQNSLNKVVETVNCKEAYAYALKIFEHCELELLNPNLTAGKRYYNLRTKEITAKALEELKSCPEE
jgi:hypothetical protein